MKIEQSNIINKMGANKTKLNKNVLNQLVHNTNRKQNSKTKNHLNLTLFIYSGSPAEIKAMCVSFTRR